MWSGANDNSPPSPSLQEPPIALQVHEHGLGIRVLVSWENLRFLDVLVRACANDIPRILGERQIIRTIQEERQEQCRRYTDENKARFRKIGRIGASRLRHLIASGMPRQAAAGRVADDFGVSSASELNLYLTLHNKVAKDRQKRRRLAFTRIWIGRGMKAAEIAARFGLSDVQARRLIKEATGSRGAA